MFKEKKFPPGWETWPKTRADWVKHTLALLQAAGKEFVPFLASRDADDLAQDRR
jgi:hypothetical protein